VCDKERERGRENVCVTERERERVTESQIESALRGGGPFGK
jgi:hypothetical protein